MTKTLTQFTKFIQFIYLNESLNYFNNCNTKSLTGNLTESLTGSLMETLTNIIGSLGSVMGSLMGSLIENIQKVDILGTLAILIVFWFS